MANPHGRPSPPPEEALNDKLIVRVNAGKKTTWQAAAERSGLDWSEWVRQVLDRAAKRQK